MAELLFLRLEGAMQSWGENAPWDNRGSALIPTKSGVVGLLACALGYQRDRHEIADLAEAITIGIRTDRAGAVLSDFHTVQGMPDILNAEGKKRGSNTIVSTRWYLQDASFLVIIDTDEAWRSRIVAALKSPVWPIYLGRKSCVPSRPILEGVFEYGSIYDALTHYAPADRCDRLMTIELETHFPGGSSLSRTDELIFGRAFQKRTVWRGSVRRDDLCI